jgi:hypothetical protein
VVSGSETTHRYSLLHGTDEHKQHGSRNGHEVTQPLKEKKNTMANTSNSSTVTVYAKRIGAMKKYVSSVKGEIPVGGQVLKPAGVLDAFQDCLDKRTAVAVTHAAYKAALAERVESDQRFRVTDEAMKGWVLNRFGVDSPEAIEFGYSVRKAPTMSVADRANALLLMKATRKARGTMGKREKLKIKGTLDVPTEPAAPAVVTTPLAVAPVVAAPAVAPVVNVPVATAAPIVIPSPALVAAPVVAPVAAAPVVTPVATPVVVPVVNAPASGGAA